MGNYIVSLLAGVAAVISGSVKLITGEGGTYWEFPVPAWTGWGLVPVGLIIMYLSIKGLRAEMKKKRAKNSEAFDSECDENKPE